LLKVPGSKKKTSKKKAKAKVAAIRAGPGGDTTSGDDHKMAGRKRRAGSGEADRGARVRRLFYF
jgi:hypothetical protein